MKRLLKKLLDAFRVKTSDGSSKKNKEIKRNDILSQVLSEEQLESIEQGQDYITAKAGEECPVLNKYNCSYQRKLTAILTTQHEAFVELIQFMLNQTRVRQYQSVNIALSSFKQCLAIHLAIENTQVYKYIENYANALQDCTDDEKEIAKFKEHEEMASSLYLEMREITKVVRGFYKDFRNDEGAFDINDLNSKKFIDDLSNVIAPALIERVGKEHSELYPVYDLYCPEKVKHYFDEASKVMKPSLDKIPA